MKKVENLVENISSLVGLKMDLTFVSIENGVVKFYVTWKERKVLGIVDEKADEVKWGYQEGEYNYMSERWYMHPVDVAKCTLSEDGIPSSGNYKSQVFSK